MTQEWDAPPPEVVSDLDLLRAAVEDAVDEAVNKGMYLPRGQRVVRAVDKVIASLAQIATRRPTALEEVGTIWHPRAAVEVGTFGHGTSVSTAGYSPRSDMDAEVRQRLAEVGIECHVGGGTVTFATFGTVTFGSDGFQSSGHVPWLGMLAIMSCYPKIQYVFDPKPEVIGD